MIFRKKRDLSGFIHSLCTILYCKWCDWLHTELILIWTALYKAWCSASLHISLGEFSGFRTPCKVRSLSSLQKKKHALIRIEVSLWLRISSISACAMNEQPAAQILVVIRSDRLDWVYLGIWYEPGVVSVIAQRARMLRLCSSMLSMLLLLLAVGLWVRAGLSFGLNKGEPGLHTCVRIHTQRHTHMYTPCHA